MGEQLITLAAAVVGAAVGLLAPMVSDATGRRARERDSQRGVASAIMDLFEGGEPLMSLLGGRESRPRRQLYLLALLRRARGEEPPGGRKAAVLMCTLHRR